MSIRTRLFLGFFTLTIIAFLSFIGSAISIAWVNKNQDRILNSEVKAIRLNNNLQDIVHAQKINYLHGKKELVIIDQQEKLFKHSLLKLTQNSSDDELIAIDSISKSYEKLLDALYDINEPQENLQFFSTVEQALFNHQAWLYEKTKTQEIDYQKYNTLIIIVLISSAIFTLLLGLFIARYFSKSIIKPLQLLSYETQKLCEGSAEPNFPSSKLHEIAILIESTQKLATRNQQRNQESLAHGQSRLNALLDSIDDGLLIVDQNGVIERINAIAQRQFAWDDHCLGLPILSLLQSSSLANAVKHALEDIPLIRAPQDIVIDANGERRLLAWRLSPIYNTEHLVIGAVMIIQDVTDQRTFERVRNEFVLRASHELRTPVTGINMAFSLLKERLSPASGSREEDLILTVEDETQKLIKLINDLLYFSRYQSGQEALNKTMSQLDQLVEHCISATQQQAEQKGVSLTLTLINDIPPTLLDQKQIQRVINHLLDNALRHTPAGGRVYLSVEHLKETISVSITDTGEGIAFSQHGRLFEPFVQIGRRRDGTGLGLALCKEIITLHNGSIGVNSQLGAGATFYFSLPAVLIEQA